MEVTRKKAKCDQSDPGGHISENPAPYSQPETSYPRPPMVMEYDSPSLSDDYVKLADGTSNNQPGIGSKLVSDMLDMHRPEEIGEKEVASSGQQKKRAASIGDTELSRKVGKHSKNDTPGQVQKLKSSLWARIRNQQFASGDFVEKVLSGKKFKASINKKTL